MPAVTNLLILFLMLSVAGTASANSGITYHGRLLKSDSTPVTSSHVEFKIQIRTPGSGNCLMYEETHVKNLAASDGVFAITINDGTATPPNSEPFTLDRIFQNRGTFNFGGGKCSFGSAYTPNSYDGRVINVSFNDGSFVGWEQLPSQAINFVPMAIESMTVGGFNFQNLLRVVDLSGDPANVAALTTTQHNTLLDLVAGTSSVYLTGASALNGANLTAGTVTDAKLATGISGTKISGNIAGNAAGFTGNLAGDVTGSQGATVVARLQGRDLVSTAPTDGQVLKWNNAASRWEPAPDLNAGGAGTVTQVTGTGAVSVTNTTTTPVVSVQTGSKTQLGVLQLANDGDDSDPARAVAADDSRLSDSRAPLAHNHTYANLDSAATVYLTYKPNNVACGNDQVLKWNLSLQRWECANDLAGAGGGIASLGGQTGSTQTFGAGSLGTTPAINSAADTHVLNIPMASTALVTSGTISYVDYMNFSGKVPSTRTITAGTGLTGGGDLSADRTLNVNVGTGNNQIVQLNGTAQLPPVSGVNLTDLNATNITSGTLDAARLPTTLTDGLWAAAGGNVSRSTGSVGIGTATPTTKLDVNGTTKATEFCIGASCITAWPSGGGGTVTNIATGAGLTGGPITSTGTISLNTSGVGAGTYKSVTVDTYGRVTAATNPTTLSGFGITDSVRNAGSVTSLQSGADGSLPAAGTAGRMYVATDARKIYYDTGSAWQAVANNSVSASSAGSAGSLQHSDGSGGFTNSNRLFYDDSAMTLSLIAPLIVTYQPSTVIKTTGIEFDDGNGGKSLVDGTTMGGTTSSNPFIVHGGSATGTNALGGTLVLQSGNSTGNVGGDLLFKTATAGSSGATVNTPTTKMTILGSGNVGIGTPTPAVKLSVNGEIQVGSTGIVCNATTAGAIQYTGGQMEFCTGTAWSAIGGSPAGFVGGFSRTTCPAGWLPADGSAVSRTSYSSLFTAIGVMYGAGNGTTTFNVPDYRGYFLRGWANGSANDPDRATRTDRGDGTTGDNVGTKQAGQIQSHSHAMPQRSSAGGTETGDGFMHGSVASAATTFSQGGNETRPRNINVIYCVSTATTTSTTVANTGTGTVNYVPLWTSATALGNSPMAISGGNVGIGTATPARRLHLDGPLRVDPTGAPGSPSAGDIYIDSGDANKLKYYNGSGWVAASGGVATTRTITAGTGLTGGGDLSADRTLAVNVGTGASQIPQLDAGGKLLAAILPSTVATSSTALAGDVTGTLSTTKVEKIQGVDVSSTPPTAGQVMTLVGSTWTPTHFGIDDLKTSLGGSQFAAGACSASQTLTWSAITDAFTCSSIVIGSSNITDGSIAAADLDTAIQNGLWAASGGNVSRASGSVGIGTTSPTEKLHVDTGSAAGRPIKISSTTTSGSITLQAQNGNGSSDFGVSANGDAYIGSGTATKGISLYTSGGEKMTILNAGNVGIGTVSPSEKLHVVGNLRVQGSTDCTLGNGAGGTNCSSDIRLKENVQEIDNSLEKILSLRGVEFDWNQKSQSPGDHAIGVIAQDVEKVFPTAVIDDPASGYKKVDYAVLVAPIIQAFKDLNKRITELFSTSESHSREIASVKAQAESEKAAKDKEIAQLKANDKAKDQKIKELELRDAETKARLDKIEKMLKSK